jgi:hypothetical protein
MRSTSTRREFLRQTSRTSLVLSAAATLGGVRAFGVARPHKRAGKPRVTEWAMRGD